jgi:hypothetical protein
MGDEMRKPAFWIVVALFVGVAVGASILYAYLTHIQYLAIPHTKGATDDALAEYTLWLMIFTGVLAIATVGLGAATVGLYLTGEKQVDITRRALVGDQRAWIATALEIGPRGLRIAKGYMELDVRLKVTNIGRSPAVGAHTSIKLVNDIGDVEKELKELAHKNKPSRERGLPVAPNDFYYRPWGATTRNTIGTRPFECPILIGCVSYNILQDNEVHRTAFAYNLGKKDGSDWGGMIPAQTDFIGPGDLTISLWSGGFIS